MKLNISFNFLFKLAMLISFLHSMHPWFFWYVSDTLLSVFVLLLIILFVVLDSVKLKFSYIKLLGITFLLLAYYLGYTLGLKLIIRRLLIISPVIILIHIEDKKIQKELLEFIANFFAILLPISLLVFGLSFVGLPVFKYIPPPSEVYGSDFMCYIFTMNSHYYGIRFASIFLEPGHLGMIMAYLLYALNFNLKDIRVIIILIGTLFTLSLAAYVLVILGFVLCLFANKKLKIRYVTLGILLMLFLYGISITYSGGDNLLYNAFFSRLEPSEDKLIAGNNRTYGSFDDFYKLAIDYKDILLWGIGVDNYDMITQETRFGGAGIKVFIIRHGLIAALCYFMGYLFIGLALSGKNKRYFIGFILLFSFSFLQRAYPFWTSWLMPLILGVISFESKLKYTYDKE